jgi:D-sedoheptulose 7-phosphate isomerase
METALRGVSAEKVREMVDVLRRVRFQNASVYLVGNGGSAATASHFANDLVKMCGVRAFALGDMGPAVSAFGNDDGWEYMFAHPLVKLLLPQDVLIAISCSGSSENVVEAVRVMKSHSYPGLKTIVLTGADVNCELAKLQPDVIIYVPFKDIRVQEDCHMVICHTVVGALCT